MLDAIYDRNIKDYFNTSQTEADLTNASNTLAQAKQNAASTLASLKGQLESKVSSLASASNTLAGASSDVATAKQALADAETAKDKAKEAKDGAAEKFVEPSYENGKLLSYEQWVEKNAVNLDPDKVDYHDEYDTYKSDTIAEEKEKYLKSFNDAYDAAVGVYNAASNDYWNVKLPAESAAKRSVTSLEEDVASLETQIKAIEEGGDTVAVKAAKDEVERLEKKLADIKAELEFWLAYKYSDNEKSKIQAEYTAMVDKTIPALEQAKADAAADVAAKEQAIKDANKALEDIATTQEALLKKLEEVTPGCVLRDGEQKALPLDTIKTEVDKFVAPYEEYEGDALNTGNALRSLVKNLKIGVELEDMESWKTAPAEEDSKGASDEDEGGDL
jgi:chromosome segregation ATPase